MLGSNTYLYIMLKRENTDNQRSNIYNSIPIYFCEECLSLRIKDGGEYIGNYCDSCGSQSILHETLDTYDALYRARYKKKLFNLI